MDDFNWIWEYCRVPCKKWKQSNGKQFGDWLAEHGLEPHDTSQTENASKFGQNLGLQQICSLKVILCQAIDTFKEQLRFAIYAKKLSSLKIGLESLRNHNVPVVRRFFCPLHNLCNNLPPSQCHNVHHLSNIMLMIVQKRKKEYVCSSHKYILSTPKIGRRERKRKEDM